MQQAAPGKRAHSFSYLAGIGGEAHNLGHGRDVMRMASASKWFRCCSNGLLEVSSRNLGITFQPIPIRNVVPTLSLMSKEHISVLVSNVGIPTFVQTLSYVQHLSNMRLAFVFTLSLSSICPIYVLKIQPLYPAYPTCVLAVKLFSSICPLTWSKFTKNWKDNTLT